MRADPSLQAGDERQALRALVRDRGPDAARDVDHLKARSLDGAAEELLARYERGELPAGAVAELTRRVGDHTALVFALELSSLGGDDVLE